MSVSLRQQATRAVLWSALQRWYGRSAQFVGIIVLARLLPPRSFGVIAAASGVVNLAQLIVDAGLSNYIISAPEIDHRKCNTAFWLSCAFAGVLYVGAWVSAPLLADVFHDAEVTPVLRVAAAALLMNAVVAVPRALLRRDLRFFPLTIRSLIGTTIGIITAITMAANGLGVWALVAQLLVPSAVEVVALYTATAFRPSLAVDPAEVRPMLRYGVGVLGADMAYQAGERGTDLLVGAIGGPVALGLWTIGTRLYRTAIELFSSVVGAVALPAFSAVRGEPARLRSVLARMVGLSAYTTIPAMVLIAVTADPLVPLLFGSRWSGAVPLVRVLPIAGVIFSTQWFDNSLWWSLHRPGVEFVLTAVWAAIQLSLVAIAAPHGNYALATAIVAAGLLAWPLRAIAVVRFARLPLEIYARVPPALVAGASAAALGSMSMLLPSSATGARLAVEVVAVVGVWAAFSATVLRAEAVVLGDALPRRWRAKPASDQLDGTDTRVPVVGGRS